MGRSYDSVIDEKICHLSAKLITENSKNALKLKDEIETEKLKMLQNQFVVAPIANTS